MSSSNTPWVISALWIALALLTFLVIDIASVRNWLLVMTVGIVPALVLIRLWNDGPPETVAELLHDTEVNR